MIARRIVAAASWLAVLAIVSPLSAGDGGAPGTAAPWPIGMWEGEIAGLAATKPAKRYLRLFFANQRERSPSGQWSATGKTWTDATIEVAGDTITVTTEANSVARLRRMGDGELAGTFVPTSGAPRTISLRRMALTTRHDGTWTGTAAPRDIGLCTWINYSLAIRGGQIWGLTTTVSKGYGTRHDLVSGFIDSDGGAIVQLRGEGGFSGVRRFEGKFDGSRFAASDDRTRCIYQVAWKRSGG